MSFLILILVLFISNFIQAEENILSHLKIISNTELTNFTNNNIKKCTLRVEMNNDMIYILDHDQNILWQFSKKGSFCQKLFINDLPLKLAAPVKRDNNKARITDFCPEKNENIILSEGNTASIYEVNMKGKILSQIKMNNSPMGVSIIGSDTIIVIDQDFTSKYLKLLLKSGKILSKIKFDQSNIKIDFRAYNRKIKYFFIKKHVLFLFASVNNEILKCIINGSNILIQSKYSLLEHITPKYIGYNTHSNKLWIQGITKNGKDIFLEIDWNSKKARYTSGNMLSKFSGIGLQYYNFYYNLTRKRLRTYGYN